MDCHNYGGILHIRNSNKKHFEALLDGFQEAVVTQPNNISFMFLIIAMDANKAVIIPKLIKDIVTARILKMTSIARTTIPAIKA